MSIELTLCVVFMLAALPVSKSIAAHFLMLAAINVAALGVGSADSSLLAMVFAVLAMFDAALVLTGGRKILLLSAATSAALCFESIMNMDWMLNHIAAVSALVNAAIAANLAREYGIWTHGK